MFNPRDEGAWYDAAGVKEKLGVTPEQAIDVLALMGDTIDNIKGVPGIGEKGARDLICDPRVARRAARECRLAHAEEISRSVARATQTLRARAGLLLRIRTDVPLPDVDMSCFDYRGPNRQKCFELFSLLGFRTLVTEYAPTADTVDADYKIVATEADLAALVSELESAGRFALSVIGDCPGGMHASLVGISFSTAAGRARYLPVGHTALDEPSAITGKAGLAALEARSRKSGSSGRSGTI